MKEVRKNRKSYKLSIIASFCFILTYIVTKENLNLILAIAWAVIGLNFYITYKKEK